MQFQCLFNFKFLFSPELPLIFIGKRYNSIRKKHKFLDRFLFFFVSYCKLLYKYVFPVFTAWGTICQDVNRLTTYIGRSLVCQQKINSCFVFIANTIDFMKLCNCFLFTSKFSTWLIPLFSFLLIMKTNEIYNNHLCETLLNIARMYWHYYLSLPCVQIMKIPFSTF